MHEPPGPETYSSERNMGENMIRGTGGRISFAGERLLRRTTCPTIGDVTNGLEALGARMTLGIDILDLAHTS